MSLVAVGDRVLVLGTTDHQVSLLTELDPDEVDIARADQHLPAEGRRGLDVRST